MKITNFEKKLIFKVLFLFFLKYGVRELRIWLDYAINGTTKITATDYEDTIASKPSFQIILKSIIWIFKNSSYLRKKHNMVNQRRKNTTKLLTDMNILIKL